MLYVFVSIFWLPIIYIKRKRWKARNERCTVRTCVEVIEIRSKRPPRGSGLIYKPIFRVCSIKNNILIDSADYTAIYRFEIGQILWIYVNPENIQDFRYDKPYITILMLLELIVGMMWLLSMIMVYVLSK